MLLSMRETRTETSSIGLENHGAQRGTNLEGGHNIVRPSQRAVSKRKGVTRHIKAVPKWDRVGQMDMGEHTNLSRKG